MTIGEIERMPGVINVTELGPGHIVVWVVDLWYAAMVKFKMPMTVYVEFCYEKDGLLKFA